MKHVVVLGDGMADRPLPELGGRTPLQAARKPNMDNLARRGEVGMVRNALLECAFELRQEQTPVQRPEIQVLRNGYH